PLPVDVFLVIVRRLRVSPLFPYTTLFRSRMPLGCGAPVPATERASVTLDDSRRQAARVADRRSQLLAPHGILRCAGRRPAAPGRDRKSTRLNSSHVESSYAVFCLKKKKHD